MSRRKTPSATAARSGRAGTARPEALLKLIASGSASLEPGDGGALRVLRVIGTDGLTRRSVPADALPRLAADDLVTIDATGAVALTQAGQARLAREGSGAAGFLAQHAALGLGEVEAPEGGTVSVLMDESESPLAWLSRRRGKDGAAFLDSSAAQAGERLRADFTRAGLTPRITSNWSASVAGKRRSGERGGAADLTDAAIAARQRLEAALDAVGPDFADLLLDVCCFVKSLTTVEAERQWPARSAKVVLKLALSRLARHYGLAEQATGPAASRLRHWGAADYRPRTG